MNCYLQLIPIFFLLSCGNTERKTSPVMENKNSNKQMEFCNSSISFDDSSSTMYISINIDTGSHLKSLADYFTCIKNQIINNASLKERFINNSKYIYFELSSVKRINELSLELINYADTSVFWEGRIDAKQKREDFFEFITQSGYAKKWEEVFSEILGKSYKCKYGAENIFYIRGSELNSMQDRSYKKEIYPYAFELYLMRE